MSSSSAYSSLLLPEEIWGKVFSYLCLKDLKSVRLTCRLFYEACNTRTIHNEEEFVFPQYVDPETIKSLINANRKVWHIRLNKMNLSTEPILPFFHKHGAQICSLTLDQCCDSGRILAAIIELCEYLHSLVIYFSKSNMDLANIFAAFQNHQTIRGNVERLILRETYQRNYYDVLPNRYFLSIFAIFPNIKQLEITVSVRESFHDSTYPMSSEVLKFSTVYSQLFKMREQLEKLKFHLIYDFEEEIHLAECFHQILQIEMKNLKELSLNWPNLWDTFITNPFSGFSHLTEIKCFVGDTLSIRKSYFLQLLLESQKQLYYLDLTTTECVSMDKECFIALVTSHLTTLIIYRIYNWDNSGVSNSDIFYGGDKSSTEYSISNFLGPDSVNANFEQSSLGNSLRPNYTLEHLRLHTLDKNLILLFSTYFLSLDSLQNYEVQTLLTRTLDRCF